MSVLGFGVGSSLTVFSLFGLRDELLGVVEWDEDDDVVRELGSLSLLLRLSFLSRLDGDGFEPVERY